MNIKTTHFSKVSNKIFLITSIIILTFMWTNFYLHSFKLSFFSSLIITTTFCLIYFPINYKLNKNKINTDNQNKNKDNFKNQILFCKSHEIMSLISQLLDYKNYTVISSTHFITQDNDIYLLYKTPLVSQKDLYDVYKSCTQNNITIFCFECENNTISPENYNLNFITLDKLFTLATEKNKTTFSNYKIKKSSKYSLYSLLCIVLSKNKANQYFKLSLLLLFATLFIPYNIYYIICSTLLILISIYCRLNKRFN